MIKPYERPQGLTSITEHVKGFMGKCPVYRKTKDGAPAVYFDVSVGINKPEDLKFATWRHCIAYNRDAELLKQRSAPGSYLELSGWIVTNALYDARGLVTDNGKPVTREYLIVENAFVLPKPTDQKPQEKQLSLVATDA